MGDFFDWYKQGSIIVWGVGDGLRGVEWEAEVASWVAPGVFGFTGLLMAVVGDEGGAEFVGAGRFGVISEWFVGERFLFFFFGKAVESWGKLGVRGSPLLLDFPGEFGERAHGTLIGTYEALGTRST